MYWLGIVIAEQGGLKGFGSDVFAELDGLGIVYHESTSTSKQHNFLTAYG
jgi:hypothetical protein